MPQKPKFLRIGKRELNAVQFGEELTKQLEAEQERELESIANDYVKELEALIQRLRSRSARRGQGFLAVRYNDPFDDAIVIKEKLPKGWRVFVDNDRFNILDSGQPSRRVKRDAKFPGYIGALTTGVNRGQPGNLNLVSPARIVGLDDTTRPALNSVDALLGIDQRPNARTRWVTLRSGSEIRAVKARNFYLAVKQRVDKTRINTTVRNKALFKSTVERR